MPNFTENVLNNDGSIFPIFCLDEKISKLYGQLNPSIFVDDGKILLNLRTCQYTLYHSEKSIFEHQFGPLLYLHPEDDLTLTTVNRFLELDENLNIKRISTVDTLVPSTDSLWHFVGLEDARLVKWDNIMYLCGVRRDTTVNGEGRMELSSLEITEDTVSEKTRERIPAPGKNDSYCEKNWMPVIDQPYVFVKWSNPTEVVKYNPVSKNTEILFTGEYVKKDYDYRGGSHVIPFGDHYVALCHTVHLFNSEAGKKDGRYRHAFIVWDKKWNVINYGTPFSFLGAEIEFCCGMAEYKEHILITFGFQDNTSYVLKVPKTYFEKIIYE
jgi:hypothetical protein